MFFENLERFGENVAIIENGEKVTYSQLQKSVKDLSGLYPERNLAFLVCSNSTESVEIYLSLLQARIPVALINGHLDQEHFQALLETYHPYYLWSPKDYSAFEEASEYGKYRLSIFEENREGGEKISSDLGVLLTTSGSTGSPKLVRQSYKNIQANTSSIVEYLGITSSDVAITTLPMHYTYGLSVLQTHIAAGASIVMTEDSIMQPTFWKQLADHHVTTFAGVPYTYEMLKKLRFLRRDVSSLRYLTQAGGKLGKDLHYEMATSCKEKGIDFIVMYGQTEATARMSYVPAESAVEKAGSIGIAIPGGKLWVIDVDGNVIETPNTPGELLYQGENVTMGYATCKEDLEKGYEQGDILHTGDVAQFDEDGFFYVVGRLKRFLKLYGNRVNLDEVEGILKHEGIECVITGIDDNMKICLLNEADKEKTNAIITGSTTIPRFAYKVYVIDEIPRNDSGKIQYNVLNEMLEEKK
ncbi:MAG: AMP-binding protein [Clostridiales bacterium]|nr:AMP-binding protein [Clostridiales bacterium]